MKKLFTLFAVAALAFAAQANELTVCDNGAVGEDAWGNLPVYGYWFDTEGMTQQIYPAEMLAEMAGGKITALKFYSAATWGEDYSDYPILFSGGEVLLSLKEVEQNVFDDEDPMVGGATLVAATVTEEGDLYLTFELGEPFEYNGGNLLVEAYWDGDGNWGRTYFRGEEQDVNCAYYGLDYYGEWYEYTTNVLSMCTFTYEAGEGPVEPGDQTAAPGIVVTPDDMVYNVTITSQDPEADIYYRITYPDGTVSDWLLYVDELPFDENGIYTVEAYAIAPGKTESVHVWATFEVQVVTGIDEMTAGKQVAGVRYFNLAGQEMQQANGLTIVVTTYTDGTSSAVKVVK